MEFERKVIDVGGSTCIIIPKDIANHLGINVGDTIIVEPKEKSKGKFCVFWKKGA